MSNPPSKRHYKYANFIHHLENERAYDALEIVCVAERDGLFEKSGLDRHQGAVVRAIDTLYRMAKRKLPAEADHCIDDNSGSKRMAYYGWRWKSLLPIQQFSAKEWGEVLRVQKRYLEQKALRAALQKEKSGECQDFAQKGIAKPVSEHPNHAAQLLEVRVEKWQEESGQEGSQQLLDGEKARVECPLEAQVKASEIGQTNDPQQKIVYPCEELDIKDPNVTTAYVYMNPNGNIEKQWARIAHFFRLPISVLALSSVLFFASQAYKTFVRDDQVEDFYRQKAIRFSKEISPNPISALEAYREADYALFSRDYDSAERFCLKSLREFGDDPLKAKSYLLLASILVLTNRSEEAYVCMEEGLEFCKKVNWGDGIRAISLRKAQSLVMTSQFHQARQALSALFEEMDQPEVLEENSPQIYLDKGYAHYLLAYMRYKEADYQGFADEEIKSLAFNRLSGLEHVIAKSSSFVGFSQTLIGNFEQAHLYFNEAKRNLESLGLPECYQIQNQVFTAFLPETPAEARAQALTRAREFLVRYPDEDLKMYCKHLQTLQQPSSP